MLRYRYLLEIQLLPTTKGPCNYLYSTDFLITSLVLFVMKWLQPARFEPESYNRVTSIFREV
jgi:hypothetical protein